MARLSARLTLIVFGLTVSLMLVVRLLVYDAAYFGAVRAALDFSSPCEFDPCFKSITPGQTTVADAVEILRADSSVRDVVVSSYIANADEFIRVVWAWEDAAVYDKGGQIELHRRSYAIEWISLPTRLTFGELWLAVGQPKAARVDHILQTLRYDDFYVVGLSACTGFWNMKVELLRADTGMRATNTSNVRTLLRDTCAETGYR